MKELHKKFIEQQFPLTYTNLAVERMLKERYSAKEIPKSSLSDLQYDRQGNYEKIFKCFKIDDRLE